MAAGSIVVELLAKTGSFETDTARAGKALQKFQKDAEESAKLVKASFIGNFAAGFAKDLVDQLATIPQKFGDMVKGAIDAADHLNDLSKKTGIAVDTLGGIGFAAGQAGGDLESASAAAGKLNKSIAEAAAGNKEAAGAFAAMGISVLDAAKNTKTADVVLAEVADKFESYADGPEKAAIALKLFGKAGADIIPLLNDGGRALSDNIEYYKRFGGVTQETAERADRFNDTMGKVHLINQSFGRMLAAELLPVLQTLADAYLDSKEKSDLLATAARGLRIAFETLIVTAATIKDTFVGVGDALGAYAAVSDRLLHGDITGAKEVGKAWREAGEDRRKAGDAFAKSILGDSSLPVATFSNEGRGSKPPPKISAPRLPASGGGKGPDTANAELKKKLDGELKLIRDFGDQQRDVLSFQNRFLEGEYRDGVMSLAVFFDDQSNLRKKSLQATLDEQDKIIAAEQAFAKKTTSPTDRLDAENKIADAVQKKNRAIVRSQEDQSLAVQQNARDVRDLNNAFQGVNAQVLELQENLTGAAAIKFDLQFDVLKRTFTAEGNAAGLQAIDTLRAATIAQAAFQKASIDAGRTLDALALQEEYLALSQKTTTATSIEGLIRLGEIRRAQIPTIEAEVQAREAMARAAKSAGTGGWEKMVADAERARLELEKLKTTLDPLADKFNEVFTDNLANSIAGVIDGTKTLKQAFSSLASSIIADMARIVAQDIAKQAVGTGSSSWGGLISSLFSSFAGGGGSTGYASVAGISGGRASGGPVMAGQTYIVGERGPERLTMGSQSGHITPNDKMSAKTINVYVQAQPNMSRATAMQQGSDIARGLRSTARVS